MLRTGKDARPIAPDLSGYEVAEIETDKSQEWLGLLARLRLLLKLPPQNIQAIIRQAEEVVAGPGEIVMEEGGAATNYFMIKNGVFHVVRGGDERTGRHLAMLSDGDGFGEDAIISQSRRNASVIAAQEGQLIRLSRYDFNTLVVQPIVKPISLGQARTLMSERRTVLLDVRLPQDHKENGLPGSINIPAAELRAMLGGLDRGVNYVVYCDDGRSSAAASFVLNQANVNTYFLAGGLLRWLESN